MIPEYVARLRQAVGSEELLWLPGVNAVVVDHAGRVLLQQHSDNHEWSILSGILDRYPGLRIFHFHAGGVLPYAAGRLDKNSRVAALAEQPTWYLKRMWVDTAMPHSLTIGMALGFYGSDRVLYGSDNPCWNPMAALEATQALGLPSEVSRRVMDTNARGLFDLSVPAAA